jgi:hypothetical protein
MVSWHQNEADNFSASIISKFTSVQNCVAFSCFTCTQDKKWKCFQMEKNKAIAPRPIPLCWGAIKQLITLCATEIPGLWLVNLPDWTFIEVSGPNTKCATVFVNEHCIKSERGAQPWQIQLIQVGWLRVGQLVCLIWHTMTCCWHSTTCLYPSGCLISIFLSREFFVFIDLW